MEADRQAARELAEWLRTELAAHGVTLEVDLADQRDLPMCLVFLSFEGGPDDAPSLLVSTRTSWIEVLDPGDVPCEDRDEVLRYLLARATGTDRAAAAEIIWPRRPRHARWWTPWRHP